MNTYRLKKSCLVEYVFVTHLDKITINVENHQNIAFNSKSLNMLRPCTNS